MPRKPVKKKQKQMQLPLLWIAVLFGFIFTIITGILPALYTLGDYLQGIQYHGFPIAWGGYIHNVEGITIMIMHVSHVYYLLGFILDVLIWTTIIYITLIYGLKQYGEKKSKKR